METYCVKCGPKHTKNLNPKISNKKNGLFFCSQNVLNVEIKSQDL